MCEGKSNLISQSLSRLTEMIEALQTQVEDLQRQVEDLKTAPANPHRKPLAESWRPYGVQSVSCLNELQRTHR